MSRLKATEMRVLKKIAGVTRIYHVRNEKGWLKIWRLLVQIWFTAIFPFFPYHV